MMMKPVSKNFIFIFHSLFLQNDRLTKNMERFNHSLREMSCMMITLQQENAQLKHQLAGTQQMVEDLQRQLEESRLRCYYLEHSVNSPAEDMEHSVNSPAEDIDHSVNRSAEDIDHSVNRSAKDIHLSADDISKILATF